MADKKRLIDANVLFNELIEKQYSAESMGILHTEYPNMRAIVVNQPTVDAVEVVRCKDCKKWDKKIGYCEEFTTHRFPAGGRITFLTRENDFCSYGERKDNDRKAECFF